MTEQNSAVQTEPVETPIATDAAEPMTEPEPASETGNEDFWRPETWGKTELEIGRKAKDVIKKIQTQYNEKSTKAKQYEKDLEATKQELEQTASTIRQALADPIVYRKYRKELGYPDDAPITEPKQEMPDFTKMQTVGDVQDAFTNMKTYFERKLEEVQRNTEAKAESTIKQAVDPIAKERWSIALEAMKTKYGTPFEQVKDKLIRAISDRRYSYTPGQEKDLLDKVFRAEAPEQYEETVVANFKVKAKEKEKSVTAAPRTSAPQKLARKETMSDRIIQKVNARLGPLAK